VSQPTTTAEVLSDAEHKMDVAVTHVQEDFQGIRTGRANPQLLHRITVDYYGAPTSLQQLAGFSVPEPRMLVLSPYDRNSISAIEKAIREADIGLNPSNDGAVIRCVFPELTEERRKEYIKLARARGEDGRIAIRNVRRHAKDGLARLETDGDIGADEHDRAAKRLEELTAAHVRRVDELLEHKEAELLEV